MCRADRDRLQGDPLTRWNALKTAMADHIQDRNGPYRDQQLFKAERRLLIAA